MTADQPILAPDKVPASSSQTEARRPAVAGRSAARRLAPPPAPGLPKDVLEALVAGTHGDPFAVLGPHLDGPDGRLVVRCFLPGALAVEMVDKESGETLSPALTKLHPDGFFGAVLERRHFFPYLFRVRYSEDGPLQEAEDPYRFSMVLGDLDVHLLAEGTHWRNYERLGAHPMEMDGVAGTSFAVWAPNARRVSIVGDFCLWDGRRLPMRLRHTCGVWELFVPGVKAGAAYKFELIGPDGALLPLKSDPYAFAAEVRPANASIVHGLPDYTWGDEEWQTRRAATVSRKAPVSIYEVHLGSWARVPEEDNRFLTYRELAARLIPYVKELGFTHIELLPVSEHPLDASWGYQPTAMYAPTSRFGAPEDFAYLVDACHQADIGVILDWVPGHFPADAHGLGWFDGSHLYEHADPRQGFHKDWNTLIYNFGRREVANFLLGSALFWLDRYHIDGLRVDAVASMLYLDYSRKAGEWIPNRYGGNENLEAIDFIRRLNELAYGRQAGVMTIAEESTAWPAVSRPTYLGGLGFGFKWNMGWMHDTLRYIGKGPIHRRYHHNDLTFGLLYAFAENFILPISHDEVVHGKGSLLARMPGDRWQRFANLRAYLGFMFAHPGKKLLFMGAEFAQEREWNHEESLDWHLLEMPEHQGIHDLVRDLNHLVAAEPALHELDGEGSGFEWIEANDAETSVLAWIRKGIDPSKLVVIVSNFTPVPREGYLVGVPLDGEYVECLNTDAALYGGSNLGNGGTVEALPVSSHGRPYSLSLTLPPLSTLILRRL